MKRPILFLLLAMGAANSIRAQNNGPSTLNAAGHSTTIGTTEVEWSVGEMTMVTTASAGGIIVTQGVLQPGGPALGASNTSKLSENLKVFPNPASSDVNIQYTTTGQGALMYRLTDIGGKVISITTVDFKSGTTSQKLDVSKLAAATYMLEVIINPANAGSESISYKIDKLK